MRSLKKLHVLLMPCVIGVTLVLVSGCSSPPQLTQVDPEATERPVNTPEGIAAIKARRGE